MFEGRCIVLDFNRRSSQMNADLIRVSAFIRGSEIVLRFPYPNSHRKIVVFVARQGAAYDMSALCVKSG